LDKYDGQMLQSVSVFRGLRLRLGNVWRRADRNEISAVTICMKLKMNRI
jgi:hypothetical protein